MADINTTIKIQKLLAQNNLGGKVLLLEKVTGGLSHNMYKVRTDSFTVAVKELDPTVMRRQDAAFNFEYSEKVARVAKRNGINAVCAMQFGGEVIQRVDDSCFLVFEWVDGSTLGAAQADEAHCKIIGQTLAKIHNTNFGELQNITRPCSQTVFDFASYVPFAKRQNKPFAEHLQRDLDLLAELTRRSADAANKLINNLVVSHRDLDCKNVLWQNFTPFLIDWESSGLIDPTAELVQVAWYWAGGDACKLDLRKFEALLNSYVGEYCGEICPDRASVIYSNMYPKLEWLNYNLQRSLSANDWAIADAEVAKSLNELEYCAAQSSNVAKVLKAYL